jgi:hypothetical protein
VVYATEALVEVLLEMAADAEPDQLTAGLAVTSAGEFGAETGLDPETPVFTHFYHPSAGESVSAVFGMNLATPPGRTQGRFVSHPQGELEVTKEDDLHGVVLVAVPPWDRASVAAFGRDGVERELRLLDAEPPAETLDGEQSAG